MPSGLGAMPRFLGGLRLTALGTTSAGRFSGAVATFAVTGSGFSASSVVKLDGSTAGITTAYVNSSQLNVTIAERHTWTAGSKLITVVDGAATAGPLTFTVTQHAHLGAEWLPWSSTYRTVSGSTITGFLDAGTHGVNLSTGGGTVALATAAMNGLDAASYSSNADYLESAVGWLNTVGESHWFHAVKTKAASVADTGFFLSAANDTTPVTFNQWTYGAASGLLAGDTWSIAYDGVARLGATAANFSWTSGESFIEDVRISSTAAALNKNGAPISLTLTNALPPSNNDDFRPSSRLTHGSVTKYRHHGSQGASGGYVGHTIVFDALPTSAEAIQVRRYLGDLFGVTVP